MSFAHGLRPEFRFPNGLGLYVSPSAVCSSAFSGSIGSVMCVFYRLCVSMTLWYFHCVNDDVTADAKSHLPLNRVTCFSINLSVHFCLLHSGSFMCLSFYPSVLFSVIVLFGVETHRFDATFV